MWYILRMEHYSAIKIKLLIHLSQQHYVKWKKSDRKVYIRYNSTYMRFKISQILVITVTQYLPLRTGLVGQIERAFKRTSWGGGIFYIMIWSNGYKGIYIYPIRCNCTFNVSKCYLHTIKTYRVRQK